MFSYFLHFGVKYGRASGWIVCKVVKLVAMYITCIYYMQNEAGIMTVATKGRQPIQDQSSLLGADILNNPRNNYYGRSSNYPQRIKLSSKHQS